MVVHEAVRIGDWYVLEVWLGGGGGWVNVRLFRRSEVAGRAGRQSVTAYSPERGRFAESSSDRLSHEDRDRLLTWLGDAHPYVWPGYGDDDEGED